MTWIKIRSFLILTAAIASLALVSFVGAVVSVWQIERFTSTGIREALLSEGMGWATVRMDGLRVILSGIAPDRAERLRAWQVAGNAAAYTSVFDEMELEADQAEPQFSIRFLRNDDEISLIGLVPSTMNRTQLITRVAGFVGGGEVKDLLESAEHPAPSGWMQAVDYSLDALGQLPWSTITAQADSVGIEAVTRTPQDKARLETRLKRTVPSGVSLALEISAPRPVIAPFTLRFLIDGGTARLDACSASSENDGERIVSAAVQAGLEGRSTCRIGLGAPDSDWSAAAVAGIRAVERFGAGSVTISDTEVSLVVPADFKQVLFDRAIGDLEAALPEIYSLTVTVSDPLGTLGAGTGNPEALFEFVANVSPEGLLHLRGRITDASLRDAVEGYARALFANADMHSSLRIDAGLPNDWAMRVLAGLEAFSELADGRLIVRPAQINIRGNAYDPNASDEISRLLSASLGATEAFTIDVSHIAPKEMPSDTLTPQECVERINAVLDGQQIGFEPGSAEIGRGSYEVIDRIAVAMVGCSEVRMEIAGHTDSQGREQMNLQLSQGRAESVLSALQSRRVLAGNLSPVGYGETRPIADNDTEEGREANRRIEFTLVTDEDETGESGEQE